MTLHEAILHLLVQNGQPMTTQKIADELNKNGWYKKQDESVIQAFQVHGRTRKYKDLFQRQGAIVSLKGHVGNEKKILTYEKRLTHVNHSHSKSSFNPISDEHTRILILGTLPGDKSLELGEYYGHPANKFWSIISKITNNDLPLTYSDKKALLLKTGIGVWDVAGRANRKGSLDNSITKEEPNNLYDFITSHTNLKVIGFNGLKSEALFDKYFNRSNVIKYISLPSTSPANTRIDFATLCKKWQQVIVENIS